MFALGNDIPLLPLASVTGSNLDRIQIRAEVARELSDEETLAIFGLIACKFVSYRNRGGDGP